MPVKVKLPAQIEHDKLVKKRQNMELLMEILHGSGLIVTCMSQVPLSPTVSYQHFFMSEE
jgi:hypothetical protein